MSREIKFRGKRIDNGEWIVGYYIKSFNGKHLISVPSSKWYNENILVHEKTVGQYTGLKDANGVEIYEGDIVESWDIHFEVKWGQEYASFVIKMKDGREGGFNAYVAQNLKVIGNIYENLELLEEQK